ncbi:hypothetical protein BOTBODRAFT_49762 [Botryobasidium botryosum FD-172 SS1]|uniref:Uncharacterized protein n=1 Tax=Botryobasidium botryosum (strain FD-172 SS1) TaxID=930990 RepID=A0A067LRL4_BOTB1|nr:hypothetical protein BOTBODRAFT_49762 [Botryobasidium botryosum FD-172 SS1]
MRGNKRAPCCYQCHLTRGGRRGREVRQRELRGGAQEPRPRGRVSIRQEVQERAAGRERAPNDNGQEKRGNCENGAARMTTAGGSREGGHPKIAAVRTNAARAGTERMVMKAWPARKGEGGSRETEGHENDESGCCKNGRLRMVAVRTEGARVGTMRKGTKA